MDTLIERTEKALLGAVLLDRGNLADVAFLDPADFQNPDNRQIYVTAVQVAAAYPEVAGRAFTDLVAQALPGEGVTSEPLHGLARDAPHPEYAVVYARMIQEAGVRAALGAHAERLETEGIVAGGVDGAHLLLLSEALASQSRILDSIPTAAREVATPDAARVLQERAILAGLLQHPAEISEVRAWLGTEVFEPGARREIYAAILTVDDRGDPVTELTVAWELGRRHAMTPFVSTNATIPDELHTLAGADVEAGAAVRHGHQLLADTLDRHLRATAHQVDSPQTGPRSQTVAQVTPTPLPPPPTITPDGPTPKR